VTPGPVPALGASWGGHSGVGDRREWALGCILLEWVAGSVRAACGGFARRPQCFLAASLGLCHRGLVAPRAGFQGRSLQGGLARNTGTPKAEASTAIPAGVRPFPRAEAPSSGSGGGQEHGAAPPKQVTSFIKDKNGRERVGCFLSELQIRGRVSSS